MNHSESIAKIAPALVSAQAELKAAPKSSDNPFFSSKYADLAECMETLREPLHKNGLAIVQFPSTGEMVSVETVLLHESGEWFSCALSCRPKDYSPQAVGSSVTYLRRYGLALTGLVSEEDDDGNAGSANTDRKQAASTQPRQAPAPKAPPKAPPKANAPADGQRKPQSGPNTPPVVSDADQQTRGCINSTLVAELRAAVLAADKANKLDPVSDFLPWVEGYIDALCSTPGMEKYKRAYKGTPQVLYDIPATAYKEILERVKTSPESCKIGYEEAAAQDDSGVA